MKRASTMLAAVLGATLGSLLQNATAQELKTIRIGWQPTTTV
jgi:ABC-type nitrate/sulfonate/bicarbonate transport system substrate-binding protein